MIETIKKAFATISLAVTLLLQAIILPVMIVSSLILFLASALSNFLRERARAFKKELEG